MSEARQNRKKGKKQLEAVKNYQEYLRRSQTPEVMGGITAVLGTFQAASEYIHNVQGDLLPAQRKNAERIIKKLKPELVRMSNIEETNEFYYNIISDLIDAIGKAHKDLTEYYKTRQDA